MNLFRCLISALLSSNTIHSTSKNIPAAKVVTEHVTRLQEPRVGYGYGGCHDTYFPQWQLPLYSCMVDWSWWADMVALYKLMVLEKCARNRCREFFGYQSRYDANRKYVIFLSRRAPT